MEVGKRANAEREKLEEAERRIKNANTRGSGVLEREKQKGNER